MGGSGGEENAARLTSRDRQRLDTRERVFEAAMAEFARVGVAQAQIESIIDLAGVSVGTFYRYFASKDAVLLELQQRLVGDVVRNFEERTRPAESLRELLHAFAKSVLATPSDKGLGLRREALALVVRTPWPAPDWRGNPLFGPITAAFAQAQKTGEIRKDLAPERLTQILATSVFGFATGFVVASTEVVDDATLLVDLVLSALSRSPADRE
jgi:TetR/AcrR family transcriptional regulator, repressor for uid operon